MTSSKISVRFVETVTVKNGTGVPDGPTYKAGDVVAFESSSADYWVGRRCAVYAERGEKAVAQVEQQEPAKTDETTVDLEGMTVKDLNEYAEVMKIDLGTLTRKADIVAAIKAAIAAKATAPKE